MRDSTADMNSLNDVFSNASALLGSTFTRMNAMARSQRGWFCNMMLFLILVIWIFVRPLAHPGHFMVVEAIDAGRT